MPWCMTSAGCGATARAAVPGDEVAGACGRTGDSEVSRYVAPVAWLVNDGVTNAGFVRPEAPVIVTRSKRRSSSLDVSPGGKARARAIIARASASTGELPLPSVFAAFAFAF